jgi:hypothetical protein
MYWNLSTKNLRGDQVVPRLSHSPGKGHYGYTDMNNATSTSSDLKSMLLTRVMQGVMLGTVLAVPVALWAYTQANPQPDITREAVASSAARAAKRSQPIRKPMRVKDAPTIPASQMHVRIDDGSRPADN